MKQICSFKYLFGIFILVCFELNPGKALAQSCTFDNMQDGTLGVDPSELNVLSSSAVDNSIIAATGRSGTIDVQCTDPSTQIRISNVTQTNNVGMALSTAATVSGGSVQLTSDNGGASIPASIGTNLKQTLQVELSATSTKVLKPGDYNFVVDLEILP